MKWSHVLFRTLQVQEIEKLDVLLQNSCHGNNNTKQDLKMDVIPIELIHHDYDVAKLREYLFKKSCADLKMYLRVLSYDPPILNKTNMVEFIIRKLLYQQRKHRKRSAAKTEKNEKHVKHADPERHQIHILDTAYDKLKFQTVEAVSKSACETAADMLEDGFIDCPIGYYMDVYTSCCKPIPKFLRKCKESYELNLKYAQREFDLFKADSSFWSTPNVIFQMETLVYIQSATFLIFARHMEKHMPNVMGAGGSADECLDVYKIKERPVARGFQTATRTLRSLFQGSLRLILNVSPSSIWLHNKQYDLTANSEKFAFLIVSRLTSWRYITEQIMITLSKLCVQVLKAWMGKRPKGNLPYLPVKALLESAKQQSFKHFSHMFEDSDFSDLFDVIRANEFIDSVLLTIPVIGNSIGAIRKDLHNILENSIGEALRELFDTYLRGEFDVLFHYLLRVLNIKKYLLDDPFFHIHNTRQRSSRRSLRDSFPSIVPTDTPHRMLLSDFLKPDSI